MESSETYVIVYTTRGEQLEPVVTINDPAQFKREKGAASLVPLAPLTARCFDLLTLS